MELKIMFVVTFVDIGYGAGVSVNFYRDVFAKGLLLGVEEEGRVNREGLWWGVYAEGHSGFEGLRKCDGLVVRYLKKRCGVCCDLFLSSEITGEFDWRV